MSPTRAHGHLLVLELPTISSSLSPTLRTVPSIVLNGNCSPIFERIGVANFRTTLLISSISTISTHMVRGCTIPGPLPNLHLHTPVPLLLFPTSTTTRILAHVHQQVVICTSTPWNSIHTKCIPQNNLILITLRL